MSRLGNAWNVLSGKLSVERNMHGQWSYWLGGKTEFSIGDKLNRSLTNPAIFTAFDMRSTVFSRGILKVLDKDGKEIENDPAIKLFAKPNYCESQTDFLKKHLWFKGLGTNMTKATPNTLKGNVHDITKVASLEHLIPSLVEMKEVNKRKNFIVSRSQAKSIEERLVRYTISGQDHDIPVGELAFFYDIACDMTDEAMFKSPSRMDSLSAEIENIEEAQRAKNKNLVFAAKWMATNKGTELNTRTNLKEEERQEIESSIFSKAMNATNADVSVTNLSGDFRKLMLDDNIASDAMRIFGAYGISKDILNWWMNGQTTFDNAEKGEVRFIQNSIQMEADDFGNTWTNFFNYGDEGKKIILDYSHLPSMQTLRTERMEGIAKQSEIFQRLIQSQMPYADALRISGLDETEA